MTVLVLLVLAVVWGVVLFSWLRTRLRASLGDPVGNFHRRLSVLERVGPSTQRPGGRLMAPSGVGRPVTVTGRSNAAARLVAVEYVSHPRPAVPGPRPTPDGARRRQTLKRRRDVLLALLSGAFVTLALGALPGLHLMLVVQVVFDLLIAGYLAMLVQLRNLAAERERKLAYLPRRNLADPPRAASARSAAHAAPAPADEVGRRRVAGDFDRPGDGLRGDEDNGELALPSVVAN